MGKKGRGHRSSCTGYSSTSLSTTQIKEIASQLSHHPQIHNFFSNHVREAAWEHFSWSRFRRGELLSLFECSQISLKELGVVVAAAHEEALEQGCREAVALALCALPCGNHFTSLMVNVRRNSGSAPFLALLADSNTCVLKGLTFGLCANDWFRRKADWSLLAHLILHNTTLKTLQLYAGLEKMRPMLWPCLGGIGIALADSIRNNRGLEELYIQDTDAFGKEGGGLALAAMLRHNSTLRTLELRNGSLCSRGTEALAKALVHNTTLKSLRLQGLQLRQKMSQDGGIALADSIRNNRGLEELYIGYTDAFGKEGGGLALAAMLRHNSTLRILKLSNVLLCSRGTEALAKALGANGGLRELFLLDVDAPTADAMIKLLTTSKPGSNASSANICHSLQRLTLCVRHPGRLTSNVRHLDDGSMNASAAAAMIRSNQKLVSFTVSHATYSSLEWANTIIPAVESNSTLEELECGELGFENCQGVDAELAYNALIRMLSNNTTLRSINLMYTPLSEAGKEEAVEEEIRQNVQYRSTLAALPKIKVKSCRLVLCGNAFAGKTTLCSTMLRLQPGNRTRFQVPQDQMGSQKDAKEQERTRGFEVNLLIDESHLRVALWDFAGQPFYYTLHDSVFPSVNGSTILLFAFSPLKDVVHTSGHLDRLTSQHLKSMQDFEDEFKYWLRFVSSNSRKRPSQPHLPSVVVVITFHDCTTELLASTYPEVEFLEKVGALQVEFKGFVHILGQPEFLDARSETHVQPFLERLRERFVNLVSDLPPVPAICEKTRLYLEGWCSEQDNSPLMSIQDFKHIFQKLCGPEITTLSHEELETTSLSHLEHHREDIQKKWEQMKQNQMKREQMIKLLVDKYSHVVALYLHDTGEVIYLDGLMDFIVVNPRWLGQGVMGHLVEEFSPYDHLNRRKLTFHEKKRGFVTAQGLKVLLEASLRKVGLSPTAVTTDKLIQLLCNLHLCYARKDEYERDGYFIPVLFAVDDKVQLIDRQLEWPSQSEDVEHHLFFGARLECTNIIQTFLTPGFFPRVQALLYDAGKKKGWDEAGTKMAIHLYGVSTNGYDVLVEFNDVTFHIDVLVRSSTQDHFLSRSFIYQNFIKPIRSFCASQEGCVGVYLTEGVLRQECVQKRTSSRYRQKQCCVSKEDLKRLVLSARAAGHFHVHQWFAVEHQDRDLIVLEAKQEYATLLAKSTIQTMSKEGEVDDVVILGTLQEIRNLTQGARRDVVSIMSGRLDKWKSKLLAFQEVTEECYPNSNVMQGKRRGLAVLISMERNRSGSSVDRGRLEALASSLGFEVHNHTFLDIPADRVQKAMTDTAQESILAEDECFVCFLNAHGGTTPDGAHFIKDANGVKVFLLNQIVEPFRKCERLFCKPKVFFINSCRGPLKLASAHESGGVEQSTPLQWSEGQEVHYMRTYSDCLLVFSTSDQAVSMRYPGGGTNFVYELVLAFSRKRQTEDVLSIIGGVSHAVVNIEVEEQDHSGNLVGTYRQCPTLVSSLTKKLYWGTP